MNEQEKLNLYIKEFKKAYLKGCLSIEDAHICAAGNVYSRIKQEVTA